MTATKLILTAALALAVATPVYSAERERRQRPAGDAAGRPALQGQRGNLEELNLTDEQREKVRAAMQEQAQALQGLRDAAPEERRDKLQKAQEQFTAKMKEVLDKDQFAKWEKSRAAGPGAGPAAGPGFAGGRDRMQAFMEELNLTDAQREKVRAAMQEQGQALQGLRDAAPEERREKFQKAQEQLTAKMKEILNKEQFEKWEKARGEMAGRLGGAPDGARKRRGPNE